MKPYHFSLLASVIGMLLFAFAILNVKGDSPGAAAKEFSRALAVPDLVKLNERTCADQKARLNQADSWQSALSTLRPSPTNLNTAVDTSRLNLVATQTLTDTAKVRVSGDVHVAGGSASTSTRVDETWRMVMEDGEWKFCGEDLYPESDLAKLLLQPSEVPFPLIDSEDTLADMLGAYPQTFADFRRAGAEGAVLKEYTEEGKFVDSFAFWFPTYGAAAQGPPVFVNFLQAITRTDGPPLLASGLGDESVSYAVTHPPEYELFAYVWRANNVVLALGIRAKPGGFRLADAKAWADKMQSHLR